MEGGTLEQTRFQYSYPHPLARRWVTHALREQYPTTRGVEPGSSIVPDFSSALSIVLPPPPSFLCSSLSVSSSHCLCLARKPLRSTASTAWRVPPLSPLPYSRPQSFYALHHHERVPPHEQRRRHLRGCPEVAPPAASHSRPSCQRPDILPCAEQLVHATPFERLSALVQLTQQKPELRAKMS